MEIDRALDSKSQKKGARTPSLPLVSNTGQTADGLPLAFNRAPCDDLKPWIARIGVTSVNLPEGGSISCGSFCEQPTMRIIYGANWTAQTADGEQEFAPGEEGLALYFGPCTRLMRLKVHGSFRVVSINFTPGATLDLGLPEVAETNDRILPFDCFTKQPVPAAAFSPQDDVAAWLEAVEQQLLQEVKNAKLSPPDELLCEFERLYLTDPGASLDQFAKAHDTTRRTLERIIGRDLGVSPRFAMRRARALDMAAALLGVASEDEEPEIRLRYFDQSHVTREMRQLFDTTPGRLKTGEHPLLRITMEIRQSRRLEAIEHFSGDDPRPWRDPKAEPDQA